MLDQWMNMQSIEYKCFTICSIHLTCQSWGGGGYISQPGPKCHIDLRSQLFHSWGGGGGTSASQNQNVTLTQDLNFSIPGGGGSTSANWNIYNIYIIYIFDHLIT